MGNDELLLLFMPALCHREEDLERLLPRERLMEAVCRWRTSQGGPPQVADDGCTGDEISGGKMHPGPATSPPRRASQFSLAPPSTPAHRLTHLKRPEREGVAGVVNPCGRNGVCACLRGFAPRLPEAWAPRVNRLGEDGRHTPRSPDPLAASPGASDPVAVRRQRSEEAVRKGAARGRGRMHGGSAQSSVAATSCDAASATTS